MFSDSNSYIFLDIYEEPLFPVPVVDVCYLIDISMYSTFLVRSARYTPFLLFSTIYCNIISCKIWNLSLKFSSLDPSTSPTSGKLPLKVFGIPDPVFLPVKFLQK